MDNNGLIFSIDKQDVTGQPGQTILEVADAAGIYIPRLCKFKDLLPGGHCRICTVRVNGRPTNACTAKAAEGLVVENDTEELNAFRRNVLEMLLVEGNHTCPACEVSGSCELQALAYRFGITKPKYPYLNQDRPVDASHPDVYVDRNRCILCGRCAQASAQIDGKMVFGYEGRGIDMRVTVDSAADLVDTDLSGTDVAVESCPTGCLVRKRQAYRTPVGQRPYDKAPIGAKIETARKG